jgi:hypothetical protein
MTTLISPLKRAEILCLAAQAKLMIEDGTRYCLNDLASEKELMRFARLMESRLHQLPHGNMVDME